MVEAIVTVKKTLTELFAERDASEPGSAEEDRAVEAIVDAIGSAKDEPTSLPFTPDSLRKRSMARAILVVDEGVRLLEKELEKKNFRVIVLTEGMKDDQILRSGLLVHRTLVTNTAGDFERQVPELEFSVIDTRLVVKDAVHLAQMISDTWKGMNLNSRGHFILRLRQDGKHSLELPA
jgi:hypothetical protein